MASERLFYIGIKGLIQNQNGDYLLLLADVTSHRKNTEPYWDIPGGRIQKGSAILDTLQREIEEETGITEFTSEPKHVTTLISNHEIPLKDNETAGLALMVYRVSIPTDAKIIISEEHSSYEWVGKAEAAKRLSNKYPEEFTAAL